MILAISLFAVLSKLLSGIVIGKVLHGSSASGVEIWANTIGRGEFSIALAALYGSELVSTTVAAMVIMTSIIGSFAAKYSGKVKKAMRQRGRRRFIPSIALRF
jgi:CPA2 family monovalent cation:H+ antiporter-2